MGVGVGVRVRVRVRVRFVRLRACVRACVRALACVRAHPLFQRCHMRTTDSKVPQDWRCRLMRKPLPSEIVSAKKLLLSDLGFCVSFGFCFRGCLRIHADSSSKRAKNKPLGLGHL